MKNLIILLMILSSFIFCELRTTMGVNIRKAPNSKAEVTGTLKVGEVVIPVDTFCHYVKVEVIGDSIHKGKVGWIWTKKIDTSAVMSVTSSVKITISNPYTILEPGVTMRSEPKKGDNKIANIRAGAEVKVIELRVVYYQIADGLGWVWAGAFPGYKE